MTDLADAHVKALEFLAKGGESQVLNCGYGHGFSVNEVLTKYQEVTGVKLNIKNGPRRAGDPAVVMSVAKKIRSLLDWTPKYDDLSVIIKTAYNWEKKRHY